MSIPLVAAVLPVWGRLLASSQAQSETAVAEMLSAFSEMSTRLDSQDTELSLLIERMYVGFQYQDRISQMLALLHSDMQRMESLLSEKSPPHDSPDGEAWLARLESQYAMAEQRRDHHGGDGIGDPPVAADNETTFF